MTKKTNENFVQNSLPEAIEEYYEDWINGILIEPHKIVLLKFYLKLQKKNNKIDAGK